MTRSFLVGVRGESHPNEDGSSRQDLIRQLRSNEPVVLEPDPQNIHDRHAVKVLNSVGKQLGFLPSDARDSDALLKGEPIAATVHAVRGGTNWFKRLLGKKSVGLVLRLTKEEPDWSRRKQLEDRACKYDEQVTAAIKLEKDGQIDQAISSMHQVMVAIQALTASDPQVSAHRRLHSPVDRLSLLLERKKQFQEALDVIDSWHGHFDPVQPNNSIAETIAKRSERLRSKLAASAA